MGTEACLAKAALVELAERELVGGRSAGWAAEEMLSSVAEHLVA